VNRAKLLEQERFLETEVTKPLKGREKFFGTEA
jgi:hypothetical protein